MEPEKRLSLLRSHINKMAPLSPTVSKVLALCNKPDASPVELNRVISVDPVLTGNVLRMINSAYYGLGQKITSVVRAITMLGINTIRNLLLSTAVLSTIGGKKNFNTLDSNQFWEHSLATGVTAKLIAMQHGVPADQVESFFIAGLLHDIGKIPLNNRFPDEYKSAMDYSAQTEQALFIAEYHSLGINHPAIGKLIAKKWSLSAEISDSIQYHHAANSYTGDHKRLVFVIRLADYFINSLKIGYSGSTHLNAIEPDILKYLEDNFGLTLNALASIVKNISSEVEKSRIFLSLTD